ncbi:class I SAM-dependent methyltransferase [Arhodomonas sp. AD133]|uniref:class I SAM-dependent methyltransferase n=1 Tax=Arhodomonas sp. AD133 TaxID=3415009 RepID=UPI003EC0B74B
MALAAAVRPGAQVVELGPGTGPVTKALIGAGVRERDLVLIETNPRFVDLLRQRFPAATVLEEDAFAAIARFAEAGMTLTAIVSSLPLMVFPRRRRRRLAMDALRALGPHGRLVQFTYGPVSPIPLDPALIAEPSRHIWNNLPPAVAWTYQHAFGYNDPQVRAEHP